jgi:hypothetical protein
VSIIRCPGCERTIDMDFEDTEEVLIGEDREIMCWPCAEKHEEDRMAEGRELAGEHHRDLNARGCTCQWVGHGNDPDAHIKRDQWCPMHGKDPDYELEKMRDEL